MTSGPDRTPPSIRIRNNQRRSRARRKEYVDDLEQRLRRFERQGVEATTEVQTAARKVARENILLRGLLAANGVSDKEIDDYLHGKIYNPNTIPLPIKAPISGSEAATGSVIPLASTQEPRVRQQCSPGKNCCGQPSNVFPDLKTLHDKNSQLLAQESKLEPRNSTCGTASTKIGVPFDPIIGQLALPQPVQDIARASEQCAAGTSNRPTSQNLMDDETTCEAAASIIAGMRGHDDTEKVLAELGCTSNQSCAVKNMTIFELTDR